VTGWAIIRSLHLLAMAFFVGGQLILAAVLVPLARGTDTLRAAARRFAYGTLIAIGVLIATGIPLASHFDQWSDGKLHVKLALVVAVALLIVIHMRRPQSRAYDGPIFIGSLAILYLGVTLAHT
jgi:putative copper export protein